MPLRVPRLLSSWRQISRARLRRMLIIGGIVGAVLIGLVGWAVWPAPVHYTASDQVITVRTGPNGDQPVDLDTTFYLPKAASAEAPVPAILLAHGFGGTKQSVASDAKDFADRGYAVLTWTAQGFGRSGGQIHLDSPDWEVPDAQRLIDWLAARPDIAKNGPNDPKVAAVGGSYGGALSIMLAGQDSRVDAIVPMITWNDLANAFLPESTGQGPADGVFKKSWAGLFFSSGGSSGSSLLDAAGLGSALSAGGPGGIPPAALTQLLAADPACGRFAQDVCAAYQDVATDGLATPATIDLLRKSSPAPVLSKIKAPTLLIQGQADSLFPLSEGEANYRAIAATGTPIRVDWFTGGHDGGAGPKSDQDRIRYLTIHWLDYYLKGQGDNPGTGFTFSRVTGFDAETRRLTTSGFSSDRFPDSTGDVAPFTTTVGGPTQRIANPPDGNPAAITILPGTGTSALSSLLGGGSLDLPGQHAEFISDPLPSNVDVVGAPTVQIKAASPDGTAVLFVKLSDLDPSGPSSSLPFGLAAPVRLTGLPASIEDAQPVTVTLPRIVYRFETGHRLRLTIATSDQAYTTPVQPATYTVAIPAGRTTVSLPQLPGTPIANPEVIWRYVLAGLVALILLALAALTVVARLRRRRRAVTVDPALRDTPLVVRGLRKEYSDGFVAVSKVDFTVERGQVVGLLGPNGAGKTTSLRVLLGITKPK
jgi:ABC-2 type transport system ATP-binding protein